MSSARWCKISQIDTIVPCRRYHGWTAKIGFYLPAVSNVGENRETERVPLFASFGNELLLCGEETQILAWDLDFLPRCEPRLISHGTGNSVFCAISQIGSNGIETDVKY